MTAVSDPDWLRVEAAMPGMIHDYHRKRGRDPAPEALESTLRTNTSLVPGRAALLSHFAARLVGEDNIFRGKDILDAGCGFGSLGFYLATVCQARSVTAFDEHPDFIRSAQALAESTNLTDRVAFKAGDMRDLRDLADASFDIVVCVNALCYIKKTGPDMGKALLEFRRVLRPGGVLIVYQANKWRFRDAFTKAPLVHLLPTQLADVVSRLTGWKHSRHRVQLVSPPALQRLLKQAGYSSVHQAGNIGSKPWRGSVGLFGNYFFTIARR